MNGLSIACIAGTKANLWSLHQMGGGCMPAQNLSVPVLLAPLSLMMKLPKRQEGLWMVSMCTIHSQPVGLSQVGNGMHRKDEA